MRAYHMSPILHPVGRVLTGNGRPKVEPEIEKALESCRPTACLSRLDSVYSREVPDFRMLGIQEGYIYRVTIHGECQRHDARWVGWLQQAHLKPKVLKTYPEGAKGWPDWTDDFVAATCAKYWAAVPSREPLWELLSREAAVEAQLSETPITVAATKDGWPIPGGA